jgi:hypothetical protein
MAADDELGLRADDALFSWILINWRSSISLSQIPARKLA